MFFADEWNDLIACLWSLVHHSMASLFRWSAVSFAPLASRKILSTMRTLDISQKHTCAMGFAAARDEGSKLVALRGRDERRTNCWVSSMVGSSSLGDFSSMVDSVSCWCSMVVTVRFRPRRLRGCAASFRSTDAAPRPLFVDFLALLPRAGRFFTDLSTDWSSSDDGMKSSCLIFVCTGLFSTSDSFVELWVFLRRRFFGSSSFDVCSVSSFISTWLWFWSLFVDRTDTRARPRFFFGESSSFTVTCIGSSCLTSSSTGSCSCFGALAEARCRPRFRVVTTSASSSSFGEGSIISSACSTFASAIAGR